MTTFQERLLKEAFLATAIFAVVMLVHGTVLGENPGCTNNTCKDINTYRWCPNLGDGVFKYIDCAFCISVGRCDTGGTNTRNCKDTSQEQFFKSIMTTLICDCANAPPGPSTVERTGTYTDDSWVDYGRKQKLCTGS